MPNCRKRGNRWYYRLTWTDETGTHRAERAGGKTRTECLKAYHEALAEIDRRGTLQRTASMTFKAALTEWLEKYVEVNLKQTTYDAYESTLRKHIIPDLGELQLRKITPKVLQDWLNDQRDKYSRSTVSSFYAVLKSACKWLTINRRYTQDNPMAAVAMPKFDELPTKIRVFTQAEMVQIFAKWPSDHRYHVPICLGYYAGLRLGECLALTWDHVDLENGTLEIVSTLYDKKGLPVRALTPKSSHAARTVTFGYKLKAALLKKQWQQKESRFQLGSLYHEGPAGGYVCDRGDGKPLTSADMHWFGDWCRQTFGSGSFHCLRHTHATMLREQGVGLDYIAARLGHSSMYTTARFYAAVTDKREKDVVKLIDKVF